MKIKTLCLNFLILFYLVIQIDCRETVSQIKVVGIQLSSVNSEYNNKLTYTVNRFNATFNYVKIFWDLKKDFPPDVNLYTKVYATTTTFQHGTLVLDNVTPICKPSKNRQLLPNIFQVYDIHGNIQCIQKGIYVLENYIQYRFEVLIPDIANRGNYFRVDYRIGNNDTLISKATFYSEWGYHNTYK